MRVLDEAEAILREQQQQRPRAAATTRRPEHSREPAFQLLAAAVHLFCAVFNAGAFLYHLRRVRRRGNS